LDGVPTRNITGKPTGYGMDSNQKSHRIPQTQKIFSKIFFKIFFGIPNWHDSREPIGTGCGANWRDAVVPIGTRELKSLTGDMACTDWYTVSYWARSLKPIGAD